MAAWEKPESFPDQSPYLLDFARIWQAADKVVYSRALKSASTARTRIEKHFDPEAVRRMKAETERDLLVGGADLAGQAVKAGVVDELHLFLTPIAVGGGTRFLPDHVRVELELQDERRFKGGMVLLRYRTGT